MLCLGTRINTHFSIFPFLYLLLGTFVPLRRWVQEQPKQVNECHPCGVGLMALQASFIGPTGLTKGSLRLLDTARYSRANIHVYQS